MKKEFVFRLVLALAVFFLVYQFGVKPIFSKSFIYDSRDNNTWAMGSLTNEKGVYDLIVVGEEPEGIAAAVSAARLGAKTLLIAQGKDLGGVVERCLQLDFGVSKGANGDPIAGGIFFELYDKLGKIYSVENYKKTVSKLINDERNINVIYNTSIISPVLDGNSVTGLNVSTDGEKKTYRGKQFIDATEDGTLLLQCNVPYFTGSEDINMGTSFAPPSLNFIMDGVNPAEVNKRINTNDPTFNSIISKYVPSHLDIRINKLKVLDMGDNRALISAIEVNNVNVMDEKAVSTAYQEAVSEAKDFSDYLVANISEFKNSKLVSCAQELYVSEKRHFLGEHVLGVNEVLENTDFADKIALSANPVEAGKLAGGAENIIGKPSLYSIPIGCIIPQKIDNLLMVGSKISFSSLAESSAGAISTGMTDGESAGVAAVYSITKRIKPRDILDKAFPDRLTDVVRLIKRQGVNLPDFKIRNELSTDQFYPEIKDLIGLGLISGGTGNNFNLTRQATEQDLAILLLNGIYRLSPDKYSLELDARLRKLFRNDKLTKDVAVETLSALYDIKLAPDEAYDELCEKGYINPVMKLKFSDNKPLTMDYAFFLADWNMKYFTGKKTVD